MHSLKAFSYKLPQLFTFCSTYWKKPYYCVGIQALNQSCMCSHMAAGSDYNSSSRWLNRPAHQGKMQLKSFNESLKWKPLFTKNAYTSIKSKSFHSILHITCICDYHVEHFTWTQLGWLAILVHRRGPIFYCWLLITRMLLVVLHI